MSSYFFILGSTPALSLVELSAFLAQPNLAKISSQVVKAELADDQTATVALQELGGSIKVCRQEETLNRNASTAELEQAVADLFQRQAKTAKIVIGIGEFGRDQLDALSLEKVKRLLTNADLKVRFIDAPRSGLSAAVLLHHKVHEVIIIRTEQAIFLASTVSVQNIDTWTIVDREKPYANRKKGMLPPKVARMMVNLAVGPQPKTKATLLDPFCGSGTVLIEAASRGLSVVGSDLDPEAVTGTEKNLNWYSQTFKQEFEFKTLQADATKLLLSKKVDYLVTEPFLGKPKAPAALLPNVFRGLEKMYLGAFKHWRRLLNPRAKVVIVFPRALAATAGLKQDITLDSLIDKLGALGYTPLLEPVLYHRPQAVIGREIRVFEFKPAQQ
ncbi:MAG: hypothetical protein COU66_00945 [Candidatus Pacebacteria bacterium CG10_big_fil_rev_8_21_14_0_10_44_11]|nr:MAG: hypothetical protein COU66_00945 [Candidatus Pacebacteria bacterium CG10_big_fil_rev_8_21_14_0_10_44_11]